MRSEVGQHCTVTLSQQASVSDPVTVSHDPEIMMEKHSLCLSCLFPQSHFVIPKVCHTLTYLSVTHLITQYESIKHTSPLGWLCITLWFMLNSTD